MARLLKTLSRKCKYALRALYCLTREYERGLVSAATGTDPRVLIVSSAEVYGAVTDPSRLPLDEDAPTAPLTPYAASKLAAEAVALQAWRGYHQPVIVVRPFNHIGPGQSPNFAVLPLDSPSVSW